VPLALEEDEPPDPEEVSVLGPDAGVQGPQGLADLVQELRRRSRSGPGRGRDRPPRFVLIIQDWPVANP
jgi:hypothetical protein